MEGNTIAVDITALKARLFDELTMIAIEDSVVREYSALEIADDVKNALVYFDRAVQIIQEDKNGK